MKLHELFHKPVAGAPMGGKALMFDNGDLVVTADGEPGQVISSPDAKGCYKVKLKNGETRTICGTELEMANK